MTLSNNAERPAQRADDLDALRDELEQADWCGSEVSHGRQTARVGHPKSPGKPL
ncbi:MAG: hypothetical protein ACRBN8_19245 [Nannocystales bacterium]